MIVSFQHKGLKELFEKGRSAAVPPHLQRRCLARLEALDSAIRIENINLPGFDFHPLRGKPLRYSIHVNGPWTITFEWEDGKARKVDLQQYH